ncbi:MAG: PEP/pyruvate-binding domain-containing protein [Phycisphaerales bacterium]
MAERAVARAWRFLPAGIALMVCLPTGIGWSQLSSSCGILTLPDRTTFDFYSDRNNFPGAMQVPEVKFTITGVDTSDPRLYFMNTKNYPYHYDFVVDCLGWTIDLGTFDRETYFADNRKNLAGSIIAHDYYEPNDAIQGIYVLEFWPTDPVAFELVQLAYDLILTNMPFARGKFYYHAAGETQRALYQTERERYEVSSMAVIQTEDLYANVSYTPLTLGESYGRLRIIEGTETVSVRDIVVYRTLPNTLSHVAGIITEVAQTPLSHINLKAKQNNTPNAYIRDAATLAEVLSLAGKYVRYGVQAEGYTLEEATVEDVNAFFDSIRPAESQSPPRDLAATEITPLSQIGFADSDSVGAKAANVAELARFLPDGIVPDGFAVPFYFYDEFMKYNGYYDQAAAMMADPAFQSDFQAREDALDAFRRRLRKGNLPDWMLNALQAMHESFPAGTPVRCRSSTNNEDLPSFNGAGLYDSYTHRPDEGHIAKSIRQVWASLWTYRAFEERDFYRVDHFQTAMGVLVHANYDDEQANGVAITKNIYDAEWPGYYVNVQVGEALVTNPEAYSIPDEFLVADLAGVERYEIQYIRHSNLVPDGNSILTKAQIFELADRMALIQSHFRTLYKVSRWDLDFAMDIEFKIGADGRLNIKQARPWVE